MLAGLTGCTRDYKFQPVDMWNGSRLKPYEAVNFFDNKSVSQHPPAGTIARGQERANEPLYYGTENGALITYNPILQPPRRPTPEKLLSSAARNDSTFIANPAMVWVVMAMA